MTLARMPIKHEIHANGDCRVKIGRHYSWALILGVAITMFLVVAIAMLGIWLFIYFVVNLSPLPILPTLVPEEIRFIVPVAAIGVVLLVVYVTRRILEADFPWANLQDAKLPEANLQWVDLVGARLQGADLQRADLVGANLQKADLRSANLLWADLGYANLQGANLQGADLRGTNFRRANLRGTKLAGANLQRSTLQWADLQRVDLKGANLREADFRDTTVDPDTIDLSHTRNWREAHWDNEIYSRLVRRYGEDHNNSSYKLRNAR